MGNEQDKTRIKSQRNQTSTGDEDRTETRPTSDPTRIRQQDETLTHKPSSDPRSDSNQTKSRLAADETEYRDRHPSRSATTDDHCLSENIVQAGEADATIIKGRFKLGKSLGSGGMGDVYQATDILSEEFKSQNTEIALKLLKADFKSDSKSITGIDPTADPESLEYKLMLLQRETEKSRLLAHPNIVKVYDFDRDGQTVFMTMERLSGMPLDEMIRNKLGRPFNHKEAIKIILGIARGLEYAHSKGIIHSDLKPGNVFVTDDGTAKLLDFGIARIAEDSIYSDNFDAGALGAVTLKYASVEMLRQKPADRRDDIFALGIIAAELLTGKHPYNRMDADEAFDKSVLPEFPNVDWKLKRLLNKAVELDIDKRVPDCTNWIRALEFASGGYKRWLGGAAAALVITVGTLIYINQLEVVASLDELPVEQRQIFDEKIQLANEFMSLGRTNNAEILLNDAYLIHQQNNQVDDLAASIIEWYIEYANENLLSTEQRQEIYEHLMQFEIFASDEKKQELEHDLKL